MKTMRRETFTRGPAADDGRDGRTRALLACGVVAGPLFVGAVLVRAIARDGFSPADQPPSFLSLGDMGWVQIANFVVCGVLFLAAAGGSAGPSPRAAPPGGVTA